MLPPKLKVMADLELDPPEEELHPGYEAQVSETMNDTRGGHVQTSSKNMLALAPGATSCGTSEPTFQVSRTATEIGAMLGLERLKSTNSYNFMKFQPPSFYGTTNVEETKKWVEKIEEIF